MRSSQQIVLTRRQLLVAAAGIAVFPACGTIDEEPATDRRQWPFRPIQSFEASGIEVGRPLLAVVERRFGKVSGVTFRPIRDEGKAVVSDGRVVSGLLVTSIAQFGDGRGYEIQRRLDDGSWLHVPLAWHLQATTPGWYRIGYSEEPLSSAKGQGLFPEDDAMIRDAVAWGDANAA